MIDVLKKIDSLGGGPPLTLAGPRAGIINAGSHSICLTMQKLGNTHGKLVKYIPFFILQICLYNKPECRILGMFRGAKLERSGRRKITGGCTRTGTAACMHTLC